MPVPNSSRGSSRRPDACSPTGDARTPPASSTRTTRRRCAGLGRPDRRDDRLVGAQQILGALAVRVGDLQLVGLGALHHVGDLGREDTLLPGDFLVDEVGDAVRRGACVVLGEEVRDGAHWRLLHHVVDAKAHLEAAIGVLRHRPDDERIGEARAPFAVVDGRVLVRMRRERRDFEPAEKAAALQIRAHDCREARADILLARERDDGDRRRCTPAPVISI